MLNTNPLEMGPVAGVSFRYTTPEFATATLPGPERSGAQCTDSEVQQSAHTQQPDPQANNGTQSHLYAHKRFATDSIEDNTASSKPLSPPDRVNVLDLRDVTYTVQVRQGAWWRGACLRPSQPRAILHHVTARVCSGQVTALLGNSGSGKTSLLDVVAGRVASAYSGSVIYNGSPLTPQRFRQHAAYVIQADRLLPDLTVREFLVYTARLKFPHLGDRVAVSTKVDTVLAQMGMRHLADSRVGGMVQRGISGGEKRRLSIATQLIQDPDVLLLDEPTTGLDSFTAHALMQTLHSLAHEQRRLVLLSIHQPRSDIFALFDHVGLLSGGQLVYYGPRDRLVDHFTERGFPCPTYANPLDHYVDVCSVDRRGELTEARSQARVARLQQLYTESTLHTDMLARMEVNGGVSKGSEGGCESEDSREGGRCAGAVKQTWTLYCRLNAQAWRNKLGMFARVFTLVTFGLLCLLFLGRLGTDLTTIQDRTGLFFECISAAPLVGMLNAIALFPTQRDVYFRESRDGLYGAPPFLFAYFAHILPFHVVSTTVFSTLVYWGCGLYPEAVRFLIFLTVIGVIHYLGELVTVTFLAIFTQVPLAQSVTTLTFAVTSLLATGLAKTTSSLIAAVSWIQYISFFKYSTEIIVVNEYRGLTFTCPEGDPTCQVVDGEAYLDFLYPGAVDRMLQNSLILGANVLAFWGLAVAGYLVLGSRRLY